MERVNWRSQRTLERNENTFSLLLRSSDPIIEPLSMAREEEREREETFATLTHFHSFRRVSFQETPLLFFQETLLLFFPIPRVFPSGPHLPSDRSLVNHHSKRVEDDQDVISIPVVTMDFTS